MNAAALKVYKAIRAEGTQRNVLSIMQTRAELYEFLGYHEYERQLDRQLVFLYWNNPMGESWRQSSSSYTSATSAPGKKQGWLRAFPSIRIYGR